MLNVLKNYFNSTITPEGILQLVILGLSIGFLLSQAFIYVMHDLNRWLFIREMKHREAERELSYRNFRDALSKIDREQT